MRCHFDPAESRIVRRKHGIGLDEAAQVFDQAHLVDRRRDIPEQFRAIGWCGSQLCSVIFEVRQDADGEYNHLVTDWQATREEEEVYAENI
jgi:uncharacterized DUF497 family protein